MRGRGPKLTLAEVNEIRRRYAEESISQSELAKEYGVTQKNISLIVRQQTWVHQGGVR